MPVHVHFIAFTSLIFLLSGCSNLQQSSIVSTDYQLSTITTSPTHQYFPGKFIWHDLITHDISASKNFYEQLFHWTFEQQGQYLVFYNQGKKIGGMLEARNKSHADKESIWLASLSVSDINKAISVVKKNGGKLLSAPIKMKKRGHGILIEDPQGAQIVLIRTRDGDPVDTQAAPGDWLWNEIWSNKPAMTSAFYKQLNDYDTQLVKQNYQVLTKNNKWRAGIRYVVKSQTKVRWVPIIRVTDLHKTMSMAETLGGKVILKPGEYPSNGDTAVISDNTGALLMLQRWEVSINKGVQ